MTVMCGSGERQATVPGAAMAALFNEDGLSAYVSFEVKSSGKVAVGVIPNSESKHKALITPSNQLSNLRIHRYGQRLDDRANTILYQYPLLASGAGLCCQARLSISADEMGIIGRGISISDQDGKELCAGIVGWN